MLRGINMKEKILIENGTIIDGTGSKEYKGNIVIEGNKIIAVEKNTIEVSREDIFKKLMHPINLLCPVLLMHIVT